MAGAPEKRELASLSVLLAIDSKRELVQAQTSTKAMRTPSRPDCQSTSRIYSSGRVSASFGSAMDSSSPCSPGKEVTSKLGRSLWQTISEVSLLCLGNGLAWYNRD